MVEIMIIIVLSFALAVATVFGFPMGFMICLVFVAIFVLCWVVFLASKEWRKYIASRHPEEQRCNDEVTRTDRGFIVRLDGEEIFVSNDELLLRET